MEITHPSSLPPPSLPPSSQSCGEGAYRNVLFYGRVVITVWKSIHPRRGKKNEFPYKTNHVRPVFSLEMWTRQYGQWPPASFCVLRCFIHSWCDKEYLPRAKFPGQQFVDRWTWSACHPYSFLLPNDDLLTAEETRTNLYPIMPMASPIGLWISG